MQVTRCASLFGVWMALTLSAAALGQAGDGRLAAVPQYAARTPGLVDINTASAEQLKALPGMGAAYAARVIRGRPYTAKNQLTQRGVLPDAAYGKIKDLIIARHPLK